MEVVLRLRMPDSWVESVCRQLPAPIKFVECKPFGETGGHGLVEISADTDSVEEIMRSISEHPEVCKVEFSPLKHGGVLGSIVTSRCAACQELSGSECFLMSAMSLDDGWVEWRLVTGGEGSLFTLMERLGSQGCEVELSSSTRVDRRSDLTGRQELIIRTASEMGYYDYPKKANLKDVAAIFDVSPSTLAEILKRAERKVIQRHFHSKN